MSSQSPLPQGSTHVVVIGGGATGALSAVALAEFGFQVTVLEQCNIGNGSSSRSAACIRAQFGIPETVLGMVYSEKWFEQIHDHLQTPADDRESVIVQNGYLFLYEDPDACEPWKQSVRKGRQDQWNRALKEVEMQKKAGLPVELLTTDEIVTRWPHLNGPRMDYMIGGTFCQTDGFLRHDRIYTLGFRRARELGVKVMENAQVVGGKIGTGKMLEGIYLKDGMYIEGDIFVNATNAWAVRLSESLGGATLPIKPIKRYLTATRRPDAFAQEDWSRLPMTIYGFDHNRIAYSRPSAGELMCGWAHVADPHPNFNSEDQDIIEDGFSPQGRSDGDTYAHALIDQVREHAPSLIGETTVFAGEGITSGFYGDTPDHNPFIGWDPGVKNLMHAAGFSGHGLMHAPITAVLVAGLAARQDKEAIIGGKKTRVIELPTPWRDEPTTALDLARFAIDRPFDNKENKVL